MTEVDYLSVVCPVEQCAASVGTECHTPGMSTQGIHIDRIDAALTDYVKGKI